MSRIALQTGTSLGGRCLRAALAAVCGAVILLLAHAGAASAAETQLSPLLALANPLDEQDLDRVRGEGLVAPTGAPGGGMQLGIILWDEYRGRQPSQGGGGITSASTSTLPSGAVVLTITTTNPTGQR